MFKYYKIEIKVVYQYEKYKDLLLKFPTWEETVLYIKKNSYYKVTIDILDEYIVGLLYVFLKNEVVNYKYIAHLKYEYR